MKNKENEREEEKKIRFKQNVIFIKLNPKNTHTPKNSLKWQYAKRIHSCRWTKMHVPWTAIDKATATSWVRALASLTTLSQFDFGMHNVCMFPIHAKRQTLKIWFIYGFSRTHSASGNRAKFTYTQEHTHTHIAI